MSPEDLFCIETTTKQLLKSWRECFEISLEEMSKASKIDIATLKGIENGKKQLSPENALKLSAYMSIHPALILFPNGYENEEQYKLIKDSLPEKKHLSPADSIKMAEDESIIFGDVGLLTEDLDLNHAKVRITAMIDLPLRKKLKDEANKLTLNYEDVLNNILEQYFTVQK